MMRKLWLLVAQATAVGVGIFLAVKAVGPDLWRAQSEVVAVKEASPSVAGRGTRGRRGGPPRAAGQSRLRRDRCKPGLYPDQLA